MRQTFLCTDLLYKYVTWNTIIAILSFMLRKTLLPLKQYNKYEALSTCSVLIRVH